MANNAGNQDDYISIESIKNIVFHFFKFLFAGAIFVGFLAKKYWIIIVLFIFSGIGVGYLYGRYAPETYKLSMVVEYNDLTKMNYFQIISQLDVLIKISSHKRLAEELNVDESTAEQFIGIDISGLGGESLEKDTSTIKGLPLLITVDSRSATSVYSMQTAILNYLNDNEYLKNLKQGQKLIYENKLVYIDKELKKMDSLKDEYTRSINSGKGSVTFYNNAFNPADIYKQSYNLIAEKEEIQKWFLSKEKAINLINGFKQVGAESKKTLKFVFRGFFFGLILVIWVIFFEEIRVRVTDPIMKKRI